LAELSQQKCGFCFYNPLILNTDFQQKYGFGRNLEILADFLYNFVLVIANEVKQSSI
jgi:hypothetical protein